MRQGEQQVPAAMAALQEKGQTRSHLLLGPSARLLHKRSCNINKSAQSGTCCGFKREAVLTGVSHLGKPVG